MSDLFQIMVLSPMWLDEDAVDLFEVDGFSMVSDGFEERG